MVVTFFPRILGSAPRTCGGTRRTGGQLASSREAPASSSPAPRHPDKSLAASISPRAPRRQQFCCQQSPRAVSWSRKSLPVPPADSAAFRQQQLRCQHLAASSPVASSFGSSISLEHWVATVDGRFKLRATHKAAGRAAAGIGDIPPTCPSFGGVWRSEPYAPGLSRVSACVHGRCMRFLLACEPSYVDATADLSACVRLSRSRLGFALAFASALGFALAFAAYCFAADVSPTPRPRLADASRGQSLPRESPIRLSACPGMTVRRTVERYRPVIWICVSDF